VGRYLLWLVSQGIIDRFEGNQAIQKMKEAHWGFESIREITAEQWKRVLVPEGMAHAIRKHQKRWLRWQDDHHPEQDWIGDDGITVDTRVGRDRIFCEDSGGLSRVEEEEDNEL